MTTLTLTKMKAGVLSIMNEADELFLMVSLINCRHFHSNLKNTTFEILKSSLKIIKQDSKTQRCGHTPVEMVLRQFQFSIPILNILSENFFQKN